MAASRPFADGCLRPLPAISGWVCIDGWSTLGGSTSRAYGVAIADASLQPFGD